MAPSQYGRVRRTGNSECDMSGLAGLRILVGETVGLFWV
jgi:hypothetical protein